MRKNSNPASRKKQAGMSLVTIAMILGIGGLILIAAIVYGPRYFTKSKVSNELAALADFRSNTVSYGARVGLFTSGGTGNATLQALINQNFFPASMVSGTSPNQVVTNQWGGSYTVAVGTLVNAGDSIVLTSTGVPLLACTELGTSLDNIVSVISINGTQTKANGAASNPNTVATNCNNGDNNSFAMTVAK